MAAAYGPPGDSRDDGFRNRANEFLQVEDVEPRDGVLPDVAAMTTHTLITATAERLAALTGEDDHAGVAILATPFHGVDQFLYRLLTTRNESLGPCNTYAVDA